MIIEEREAWVPNPPIPQVLSGFPVLGPARLVVGAASKELSLKTQRIQLAHPVLFYLIPNLPGMGQFTATSNSTARRTKTRLPANGSHHSAILRILSTRQQRPEPWKDLTRTPPQFLA